MEITFPFAISLYLFVGFVWGIYKTSTPISKEIENEMKEEYPSFLVDRVIEFMECNRFFSIVIYCLFWPVNMFFNVKTLVDKLIK